VPSCSSQERLFCLRLKIGREGSNVTQKSCGGQQVPLGAAAGLLAILF
jgi:hypothetical protein